MNILVPLLSAKLDAQTRDPLGHKLNVILPSGDLPSGGGSHLLPRI